jgi:hypothetical protein
MDVNGAALLWLFAVISCGLAVLEGTSALDEVLEGFSCLLSACALVEGTVDEFDRSRDSAEVSENVACEGVAGG